MPPLEESDHPRYHVRRGRRANRPFLRRRPARPAGAGTHSGVRPRQSSSSPASLALSITANAAGRTRGAVDRPHHRRARDGQRRTAAGSTNREGVRGPNRTGMITTRAAGSYNAGSMTSPGAAASGCGCHRAMAHNELAGRIVDNPRRAGDDYARPLPGSLVGEEGEFRSHPLMPERNCWCVTAVASDSATLGCTHVRLHPDRDVDEMLGLVPSGTHAFDDDEASVRRHRDRSRSAVSTPPRWPELDGATGAQRLEHVADEHLRPIEERVVPGEVVGADDDGPFEVPGEGVRDRGLAAATAPVDGDDTGASTWPSELLHQFRSERRHSHDPIRSEPRLLRRQFDRRISRLHAIPSSQPWYHHATHPRSPALPRCLGCGTRTRSFGTIGRKLVAAERGVRPGHVPASESCRTAVRRTRDREHGKRHERRDRD